MLAVARTVTSINRLLDVLPVLAVDPRVEVVFTVDTGSVFADGVTDRLRAAGARVIDWKPALVTRFDLALSASDHGELHRIRAPLVLLPHGAGFHRFAGGPGGTISGSISGLAASALTHRNRTVPSLVVVSHPDQVGLVRRVAPGAAARALVAGDPCLDRILLSRRLADRYRRALDADDRNLVVMSSTWGPNSLLGRHPNLPARLLGELPTDQYRVAAVLHPNIWSWHGGWQIRAWLRRALDAGLILLPPDEGWRAALIAARIVVSDHGSISSYAAALGKPLLLAADGAGEVVPDSPMDILRRVAPRLTDGEPIRDQIESAMRTERQDHYLSISETIFANRGRSADLLRAAMYGLMMLPVPPWPARSLPVPIPDINRREPTAFAIYASVTDRTSRSATIVAQRFPASTEPDWLVLPGTSRHLAVHETEPDDRLAESAAVLVGRRDRAPDEAALGRAADVLADYPGCRVAAVRIAPGRVLMRLRGGMGVVAAMLSGSSRVDPAMYASAVYTCAVGGMVLPDLEQVTIRLGDVSATIRLDVVSWSKS